MKLAVIGSRDFNDYATLVKFIDQLRKEYNITHIVSGGANGADKLSEKYARENNIPIEIYRPDWERFGKSAGYIRNTDIWNHSDMGVAFWDGESKGTSHSFKIAKSQGKKLFIFNSKTNTFYLN